MTKLSYLSYQFFNIIMLLMLIRVLLSWIPNVNWYAEPWHSLRKFTDYIFEPFRRVIPPIGMIDISPIFAFIVITLLQKLCIMVFMTLGI